MSSVILGTAQWGLDYGVSNREGRLTDAAITAILARAHECGVSILDTAPAYGDAESRIATLAPGFSVQTKVSASGQSPEFIRESVETSTQILGQEPSRVLVHDWPVLTPVERAATATVLESLRDEGRVLAIGVSGYAEDDLATALESFGRLDVAQVPVSVLDQRLRGSPAVSALRARGGLLQARSIYLQGVAVATGGGVPWTDHPDVLRLRQAARDSDVMPPEVCVSFIRGCVWVDEVVVGVTTVAELDAFMSAWDHPTLGEWSRLASADTNLLDPRRWPPVGGQGG